MPLQEFQAGSNSAGTDLPVVLTPPAPMTRAELIRSLSAARDEFLGMVSTRGAVILRDVGEDSVEANQRFIEALGGDETLDYSGGGGADRARYSEDISGVTPSPRMFPIPLHNELAYTDRYPRYICFFCHTPPARGGATSIADGRAVYQSIDEDLRDRLESVGVTYKRFMFNSPQRLKFGVRKSWQETFLTRDREEVEARLDADGIEWRWDKDGLYTRLTRPAFHKHPVNGKPVWFNHIQMFEQDRPALRLIGNALFGFRDCGAEFGSGEPIPVASVRHINQVIERYTVNEPWHKDDILVVDNIACMHGRETFSGERRVSVGMFNEPGIEQGPS